MLTSPLSRTIKRQSAISSSSSIPSLSITPIHRAHPAPKPVRPSFSSLSSLLTVNLTEETKNKPIVCLEEVINIKDEVHFECIVLRVEEETERANGYASRVVMVRDVERNDVAKVVVYYERREKTVEKMEAFVVVRVSRAYRVISSSLNVYFRVYLHSPSSISQLSSHLPCSLPQCPCRSLTSDPSKAALRLHYPPGTEAYLPAIHTDVIPQRYFSTIGFDRLERGIFRANCVLVDVMFLMLEMACRVCAKRAGKQEEVMCPACATGSMEFNIRAGVLLDDSSGVLAESVLETLETVQSALYFTNEEINVLKEVLESSGMALVNLAGSNIPEWVKNRVHYCGAKESSFVVQCQSYVKQTEHLTDSYMRYLHNCVIPTEVSLNRKPPDVFSATPRPYVKVMTLRSPLSFLLLP